MTLDWPWPILWQGKIWFLKLLMKAKTVHFSATIVVCDMEMQSILIPRNAKGQGHLVTLVEGHSCWIYEYFESPFSKKLLGQFKLYFI